MDSETTMWVLLVAFGFAILILAAVAAPESLRPRLSKPAIRIVPPALTRYPPFTGDKQ